MTPAGSMMGGVTLHDTRIRGANVQASADHACVVLVASPNPAEIGTVHRLEAEETVLGRAVDAGLRLHDTGVSRHHAKIARTPDGGYQMVDLGSTNGILLNGRPLTSAQLCDGDRIQLGTVTLKFSTRDQVEQGEELLRQALTAARLAIWSWNAVADTVSCSTEADRALGLPPGSVTGRADFLSLINAEDRPRVRKALAAAIAQEGKLNLEYRLELPGGARRWVHCQGDVVRDSDGRPVRITGTMTDVTERKQAEQDLRRQAQMFESLCVNDGVVTCDLGGRIIDWNQNLRKMFGLTRSEVRGRPLGAVFRPDAPEALIAEILQAIDGVGRWTGDVEFRRRDGGACFSEAVAVPLRDSEGRSIALVMVHRDITERRRMQAQLLMADRLASVGTLASGIAHEVNNPLAFITLNMEFLERGLQQFKAKASPEEAQHLAQLEEVIKETRVGTRRIGSIVNDLKTFARGGQDDRLGPVDLRPVVELACKMAHNVIRHRARLITDFQSVPLVEANESRLGQVMLNLVLNAAQAIPEGQSTAHEIAVTVRAGEPGRVIVEVRDTGVGMTPEILARIFDPFFTTKPVGVGTGLGLSICHGILEAMGGRISVDSTPGQGSTFRVSLRALVRPGQSAPTSALFAPALVRIWAKVLVVDDEPSVTQALKRILGLEHDVTAVNRAREALELLDGGARFDVILCDVMMPEMTGMALHAELRRRIPDQADRVVFMTGGAFTPGAVAFLEAVPNPKAPKPLDRSLLRKLLDEMSGPPR